MFDPFADKEPLGLVVLHAVVALVTAPTVGQPQLLPAVGRIDGAAELCGIDEGFHPQAQAVIALGARPTDPLIAVLEMFGGGAEEQQRHPAALGIDGGGDEDDADLLQQGLLGLRGTVGP